MKAYQLLARLYAELTPINPNCQFTWEGDMKQWDDVATYEKAILDRYES